MSITNSRTASAFCSALFSSSEPLLSGPSIGGLDDGRYDRDDDDNDECVLLFSREANWFSNELSTIESWSVCLFHTHTFRVAEGEEKKNRNG